MSSKLKGKSFIPVKVRSPIGVVVKVDPTADLTIGPDLTLEMAAQAGLFAWYGALAEEMHHRAKAIKSDIHCLQEDLDAEIREDAAQEGVKLTEKGIEFRINRHPKMRALYQQYISARRKAGFLHVYKEALKQKADMLRSIGANNRSELDQTEIRTLQSKAKRVVHHAGNRDNEE